MIVNKFRALAWLLAPIISLVSASFILPVWQIPAIEAAEKFEFKLGDKIHVLSDKGYRHSVENTFEAIGNVIINHESQTLYGEKASISMATGETNVQGNVRYVGTEMTLYGSEIHYNFLTQKLDVFDSRLVTDTYVVLGKKLSKIGEGIFFGEDAEYTTCRDCPESWSILGKKVHVTVGEYIRITHAFIKSKGIVVLYLPYVVLPIKKKRETGLLFPRFGVNFNNGIRFQQPFFWNIADHKDATIAPSAWGGRGLGQSVEYRHHWGDKRWMELNTLQSWDGKYIEYQNNTESTGNTVFRHYSEFENQFFLNQNTSHYIYHEFINDLDMIRDYEQFMGQKVLASDLGVDQHINHSGNLFTWSLESSFKRNQLVQSSKTFDHQYIQVLPELRYASVPFNPLSLGADERFKLLIGIEGTFSHFKQNHREEGAFIRNAARLNNSPYATIEVAELGPFQATFKNYFEHQYYHFPHRNDQVTFKKYGTYHESELVLEVEKMFGLPSWEDVPAEYVVSKDSKELANKEDTNSVGKVPEFKNSLTKETVDVKKSSYRHKMDYRLKHYYISQQKTNGSEVFRNQIQNPDKSPRSQGVFDSKDIIRGRENELNYLEARTGLPTSNTLEFQWNNQLIKKKPSYANPFMDGRYLKDNFSYSSLASFNISQGVDLNPDQVPFEDRLTRLATGGSVTVFSFGISAQDYYFHRSGQHITTLSLSRDWTYFGFNSGLTYDSFTTPVNKIINTAFRLKPLEVLRFETGQIYDMNQSLFTTSTYSMFYTPTNKCWIFDLTYTVNQVQKQISFNFMINFNENQFRSLNGM